MFTGCLKAFSFLVVETLLPGSRAGVIDVVILVVDFYLFLYGINVRDKWDKSPKLIQSC